VYIDHGVVVLEALIPDAQKGGRESAIYSVTDETTVYCFKTQFHLAHCFYLVLFDCADAVDVQDRLLTFS
ncbi:MAG: hypothetical protein ACK56F_03115, partial [bacterium]